MTELKEEAEKGEVTAIGNHSFTRNGVTEEFDKAISTIPLDVLSGLRRASIDLPTSSLYFLHIHSESLDFEGNNQLLVVDPGILFFKVTNIAPNRYLIYWTEELKDVGIYLMRVIESFDIIDGTSLENALPAGEIPDLRNLEEEDVFCVGGYAQWDWCMDVGSCILRLLKYANRGLVPAKPKEIKLNE